MKIVVIGGSGFIGAKLVKLLRKGGNDVLSASPSSGVNTITGEGLSAALCGADVVVDLANSPSYEANAALRFFDTSGRNILAAECAAGVKHHLALSVVGTDRNPKISYFQAKLAQESLIRSSKVPYTIVRSTQFYELLIGMVDAGSDGETSYMPSGYIQPIASDDITKTLAEYAQGKPVMGIVEVAGPERMRMHDLAQRYLAAIKTGRTVVGDARAHYLGAELSDRSLVPRGNQCLGTMGFDEWLSMSRTKYVGQMSQPTLS